MKQLKLKILWVGPSLNAIKGKYWAVYAKHKKDASRALYAALKRSNKTTPITVDTPVEISLQSFMGKGKRCFDHINYALSFKMLEDALVQAKVIPDDTNRYVSGIKILSGVRYLDWKEKYKGTDSFIILKVKTKKNEKSK